MNKDEITTKIIAAIKEEALQYPGDDPDQNSNCVKDEATCLHAHVHEFITIDGNTVAVAGAPERFAAISSEIIAPLIEELNDYEHVFNLHWKASMKAIELWTAEDPIKRELKWPDHKVLIQWLLDKIESQR